MPVKKHSSLIHYEIIINGPQLVLVSVLLLRFRNENVNVFMSFNRPQVEVSILRFTCIWDVLDNLLGLERPLKARSKINTFL